MDSPGDRKSIICHFILKPTSNNRYLGEIISDREASHLGSVQHHQDYSVQCPLRLWGVQVQPRIQDNRILERVRVSSVIQRAAWDLTQTLIRPLGCVCKIAHCLPTLWFSSKRESGQRPRLSSSKQEDVSSKREKRGQSWDDVKVRNDEGALFNRQKKSHFNMTAKYFLPVASMNDCWSKSGCYKWIRGYLSLYYFCFLTLK